VSYTYSSEHYDRTSVPQAILTVQEIREFFEMKAIMSKFNHWQQHQYNPSQPSAYSKQIIAQPPKKTIVFGSIQADLPPLTPFCGSQANFKPMLFQSSPFLKS
jgi:hypothetical protein